MPNLLLLCHGGLDEFSAFDVTQGSCVQYRGNYGTNLSASVAQQIFSALLSNPTIDDRQLGRGIQGYTPHDPLGGPRTYRPDVILSGDDNLPCFLLNLNSRRWTRFDSSWTSRLRSVTSQLSGTSYWLNLLCCTNLPGANVTSAYVDHTLQVPWQQVL